MKIQSIVLSSSSVISVNFIVEHKDFPLSIIPSVYNPHFFKICIVSKGWDYRQGLTVQAFQTFICFTYLMMADCHFRWLRPLCDMTCTVDPGYKNHVPGQLFWLQSTPVYSPFIYNPLVTHSLSVISANFIVEHKDFSLSIIPSVYNSHFFSKFALCQKGGSIDRDWLYKHFRLLYALHI